MTNEDIGTSAFRFELGLSYLAALGPVDVGGGIGFGIDSFSLEDNTIMPAASYTYLRPGLIGRLPLLADGLLAAQIDVGLRLALGVGDIGTTYSTSGSAFGFDVGAGLLGALDMGLTYGLRFTYLSYGLSFEGDAPAGMT